MINVSELRFDGKFNYQNGLLFYFSKQGRVISFLIQEIGDRKRRIRVTMQPDRNHERPHVHINDHGVSFAIDTGELLAGKCETRTQRAVEKWIERHRSDLLELWEIVKAGRDYRPKVERIRRDEEFGEYGFKGIKPESFILIDDVKIWYDGKITQEKDENNKKIISEGNMFVGLPNNYQEGRMIFESLKGSVQVKNK